MIEVNIPGFENLVLKNVIFDYNGTLAVDGYLIEDVKSELIELSKSLRIHLVTGDSLGTATSQMQGVPCELVIAPSENQGITKQKYLHTLNPKETVAIGNGRNDKYILKESAVGILVLGHEGMAVEAFQAADVVVPNIFDAINLLFHPNRLRSTLRA